MAVDLFSHTVDFGGAIAADGVDVTFASTHNADLSGGVSGLYVQQMQWQYAQQISRVYDVTSPLVALVSGRTQGGGSMSHVLGPAALTAEFFSTFGNVCYADGNTLTITGTAACGGVDEAEIEVQMHGLVISTYSGGISAQDMLLTNAIQFIFTHLTYDDDTSV